MSLFDWVELGAQALPAKWTKWLEAFKGSCTITVGDVLNGTFGSVQSHVFGGNVDLVFDPEDMFADHVIGGKAAALLSGSGGNVLWVYGSSVSATYVGPKIDIHRAESISRTAPNLKKIASEKVKPGQSDEIDDATARAVKVFSVLICTVAATFDLAVYLTHKEDCSERTVENLKILSYSLTSRLIAMLKDLEEKATWAEFAKVWEKDTVAIDQHADDGAATDLDTASTAALLKEAENATGNALKDAKNVVDDGDKEEEKPPEDKPPEEKPPEDKPPEEKPPEDKPPEDKPPEDKPPEDKPPEDKPPEDKPPEDKPPEDKPPEDKPPEDKPPEDKPPEDKPPEDKPPEDKPPEDKPPEDKPPEEKPPEEKPPEEKPPEEKPPEDKPPEDKPPEDKPPEDKPPEDKPPEDKPPEDKPPEDKPPEDKPPEEKPPEEKPPEEKPPEEKPPEEKPAEKKPTEE